MGNRAAVAAHLVVPSAVSPVPADSVTHVASMKWQPQPIKTSQPPPAPTQQKSVPNSQNLSRPSLHPRPDPRTHPLKPQGQCFQRIQRIHDLLRGMLRRVFAQLGVYQFGGVLVAVGGADVVGVLRSNFRAQDVVDEGVALLWVWRILEQHQVFHPHRGAFAGDAVGDLHAVVGPFGDLFGAVYRAAPADHGADVAVGQVGGELR